MYKPYFIHTVPILLAFGYIYIYIPTFLPLQATSTTLMELDSVTPLSPEAPFYSFHKPTREYFMEKKRRRYVTAVPTPQSGLPWVIGWNTPWTQRGVWTEEWDNFISAWTVLGAVHWISYANCQVPPMWIPAKTIGYACTAIHSPEYFAFRSQILCLLVNSGALADVVRDTVVVPDVGG